MALVLDEIQVLLERRNDVVFAGPRSEEEIAAAEAALGMSFPAAFRAYLRRWGSVDVSGLSLQYLGLFSTEETDLAKLRYPSVVSQTLRAWSRGLPRRYVMVRNQDGTLYVCLDIERRRADGECLVTRWDAAGSAVELELKMDFAESMLDEIVERQEYWGTDDSE